MKAQMSEQVFRLTANRTRLQPVSREAARRALVQNHSHAEIARALGVTRQRVGQYVAAVLRVATQIDRACPTCGAPWPHKQQRKA